MFVFVTARVLEAALMQNFYASHLPKPFAFSSRLQIAHASKSVSFIHAWLHFPGLDGKKKNQSGEHRVDESTERFAVLWCAWLAVP